MSTYNWTDGNIPRIYKHSLCKHEIIKDYLIGYIDVRCQRLLMHPGSVFNLTIVDGFAGGGRYDYGGETKPGSPIIIIEAINEAVASFRSEHGADRVKFSIDLICVEKDKGAMESLRCVLKQQNHPYGKIAFFNKKFGEALPYVVSQIQNKTNKRGKCLFFLDQYGYTDVSMMHLQKIMKGTNSEIILTFAKDALITFLSDSRKLPALRNLMFPNQKINELMELIEALARRGKCPQLVKGDLI